jgi:hypothetical protein
VAFVAVGLLFASSFAYAIHGKDVDAIQDRLDNAYEIERHLEADLGFFLNQLNCDNLVNNIDSDFESTRTNHMIQELAIEKCL